MIQQTWAAQRMDVSVPFFFNQVSDIWAHVMHRSEFFYFLTVLSIKKKKKKEKKDTRLEKSKKILSTKL